MQVGNSIRVKYIYDRSSDNNSINNLFTAVVTGTNDSINYPDVAKVTVCGNSNHQIVG